MSINLLHRIWSEFNCDAVLGEDNAEEPKQNFHFFNDHPATSLPTAVENTPSKISKGSDGGKTHL